MTPTPENLSRVRVLYRQPDTLALWGIPYDMRWGQQPYDIQRGAERAPRNPMLEWIWLGQPGWWGPYAAGSPERTTVEAFLARLPGEIIPNGPCEWSKVH